MVCIRYPAITCTEVPQSPRSIALPHTSRTVVSDAVSAVNQISKVKVVIDETKPKKKRGRPSNAEIAEREAKKAKEAASMKPDDVVAAAMRRHSVGDPPHANTKPKGNQEEKEARRRRKEELRKRRRESAPSPVGQNSEDHGPRYDCSPGLGLNTDWLKSLESSMSGIGERFIESANEPLRKVVKKKSQIANFLQQNPTNTQPHGTQGPKKNTKTVRGYATTQKASPVPLPPPKTIIATSTMSAPTTTHQMRKMSPKKLNFGAKEILVPETPEIDSRKPSQDSQMISPSPLAKRAKTSDDRFQHVIFNPSFSFANAPEQKFTPVPVPTVRKPQQRSSNSNDASTLTKSSLKRSTAPLSDKPKSRTVLGSGQATSDVISTGTSCTSSASSAKSLPDYFTRVPSSSSMNKPCKASQKRQKETHEEAPLNVFNNMFQEVRKTVNFTHEQEELNLYLEWHRSNDNDDPLPCLGSGSGCTEKKESILRLGKEENVDVRKALENGGHNPQNLRNAEQGGHAAEELLILAIRARLPVPIGRIDGTWTLYCPKYAKHHFDKYGYGFRDSNNFTARLSIPPRPMTYSILTFAAPPHASFRTTIITTATEGYKMEVIFLGNGYLQLRASDIIDGKNVMEFFGVHKHAVEWVEGRKREK
ncbi:hypothetical protein BDV96DRAFT_579788 [Lophiotrema nucula]|uniref:Uncharacterized protein n=1 Tax=Lophiotrema nucula TaxID=690887 RepID=A0A6A5Z490_9PLEO|nr:hypothetical protein BDV96DRAFT_579788 [Lophiotrema nucula]